MFTNTNRVSARLVAPLLGVGAALGLAVGCDYDGAGLYPQVTEVPGIIDLGVVTPSDVTDQSSINDAIMYAEVGSTGTSQRGGVTMSFVGTGNTLCLWVDPEAAFWDQAVSPISPTQAFAYPDNQADDGDLDMYAGLSVYYSGSPGEEIGTFQILYQDQLGNKVPVDFNECTINDYFGDPGGHAGRGTPESCTLTATQPGVSYTILLSTWSTPTDDDRLAYGFLLTNGSCQDLVRASDFTQEGAECVIGGESTDPATGEPFDGEDLFEASYCTSVAENTNSALFDFCTQEAESKDCSVDHCFCGDPNLTPTGSN